MNSIEQAWKNFTEDIEKAFQRYIEEVHVYSMSIHQYLEGAVKEVHYPPVWGQDFYESRLIQGKKAIAARDGLRLAIDKAWKTYESTVKSIEERMFLKS